MERSEKAIKLFSNGWNCNQSVLASWSPDFGVTEELGFKIGLSYGGGMGRMGKTCGAVTGAYTAIGLWAAEQAEDKPTQKKIAALKVQEFNRLFIDKFGKLECKELLGYDFTIPEESAIIAERKLTDSLCPVFVGSAADLLNEVLK
jgi:C_GCAxxG_C_C family probable redox protein